MIDDEPLAPMGYRLGGFWSTTAFVGRGPVGEVYECERREVPGTFIAKVLPEELLETSEIWSSYLAAVSAAGALPSEATVRHVAFGSDLQLACPFVVTERVEWPSLAALVAQAGPLTPAKWGQALVVLVSLLDRAHAASVPHGRLTPSNVFVSPDDPAKVKVTDFGVGIACAARAGETLGGGVLGWIGPESEAEDAKPSALGDVYSLGLLTFFALTGKKLFHALGSEPIDRELLRSEMAGSLRSASEIARKQGAALDPALDKWFSRTIVPNPTERYSSVKLQGEAFEHLLRRMVPGDAAASKSKVAAKPAAGPPRPGPGGSPSALSGSIASKATKPATSSAGKPAIKPAPAAGQSPDDDPLDEEPTIRLRIETLLGGARPGRAQDARDAALASQASKEWPGKATAPVAIPAPPVVIPAPPVAIPAPPVVIPAPPVAIATPPVDVPPPPLDVVAPTPLADEALGAVAEPASTDAAIAVEPPLPVAPSGLAAPESAAALDVGSGTASPPLVTRPKIAIVIALGLVLFGVAVGLVLGARTKEPPAGAVQSQSAIAERPAPAPAISSTPPLPAAEATAAPTLSAAPVAALPSADSSAALVATSASASPSASAPRPTASSAPAPPIPPPPPSATARVTVAPTPAPAATPKRATPAGTQTAAPTSARKPAPAKTSSSATAAPARKKPCGTFINPCK